VSSEEADKFSDVDVFVTYGDDSLIATLQADPLLSKIPAIAEGRIAILPDATPIAASANPSPLSIPWGLSDYLAILAAPLEK
jgi:iron complex transport system substrate-binding protein